MDISRNTVLLAKRASGGGSPALFSLLILLALIAAAPLFAQRDNSAFEEYRKNFNAKKEKQREDFNAYKQAQRDKFNAFMKKRWHKFKNIPEADLPDSPDSLEIKVIDIPEIKEDENPDIEIINALLKEGVSEERSAQIALEIIDSLGIDAIKKGQSIGIAAQPKNEEKPMVVSYNVDEAETVTLLKSKSGGYKYVESDEKVSDRNKQLTTSSQYVFPLKPIYRRTSAFGMRSHPILRRPKMHEGVDYGAAKGNPVYSIADGTVTESSYGDVSGNFVAIKHSDGMYSYYLHLNERGIAKGSKVAAGQAIGKVGTTGRSTGPHLHFGIKINGAWQNPEKVLGVKQN